MTTAQPPLAFQPARREVSTSNISVKSRKGSGTIVIEESLRTYQLLEALRANDTASLQTLLSTYTPHQTPSNPNLHSLSLSGTPPSLSLNPTPSPLTLAVQCATTPTVDFVISHLPHGFDINQRDQYGNTALHYAAKSGRSDVLDLLLKQRNINDTLLNNEGKQAVEIAKNPEIVERLKVNRAQYVQHVTALFRQHISGADYDSLYSLFNDPRAASLIDINLQDGLNGGTLLHDAARKRNFELVQFCLDHGADVNVRDRKGKLPIELTKDEKIKNLLKEVSPNSGLVVTTLPNQAPKLKGYLHKWTNYAGGYKTRWFVLENGILSYFKNQDDAGNSCRGSINMRIATISMDATDRQRFDIIGKGSVRYHLRANHPSDAKKWIGALQQSIKWVNDRRSSFAEDIHSQKTANLDDDSRSSRSFPRNDVSSIHRERSRSPDDDSIEVENVPHADNYQIIISSAKAQLDMQSQLLDSLLTICLPSASSGSRQPAVVDAFKKSLTLLQNFVDDVIRMSEERDSYWQQKLEKELEAKRLWEESMCGFAKDQAQMEQIIQENVKEQKRMKKLSKLFQDAQQLGSSSVSNSPSDSRLDSLERAIPSPNLITANTDAAREEPGLFEETPHFCVQASTTSLTNDIYDSDDEFFDAIDGDNNIDVTEAVMEPSSESNPSEESLNYIASSYSGYPDHVRDRLPLDQKSFRPDVSLWSILKNSIGKDLSKITLPVYFNEPTSMLQRMAEDMEYSELLDIAARQKGSTERILYVAAFAMSNYSSTVGRVAKPFNPLLGETYEYVRPDKAFRYLSEQVSHHPPISACYCESPNYDFFAEVDVKSKFWGKSFEILPKGVSHVNLKVPNEYWPKEKEFKPDSHIAIGNLKGFSEHYSWKKVTTCVNNLIVGSPWIDHYGDMIITNHLTGDKCVLTFKARGWRGKDAFEIRGIVNDSKDNEIWEIAGRWNERLVARRSGGGRYASAIEQDLGSDAAAASATIPEGTISHVSSPSTNSNLTNRREILLLWKRTPLPENPTPFNLTPFAITLNDLPKPLKTWVAPTDSRLRPDQRAMENGQYDLASTEKVRLEEKQRSKRKLRERGDTDDFKPRWFIHDKEQDTGENYWRFNHEYWKERERVGQEKTDGNGPGKWNIDDDDIF